MSFGAPRSRIPSLNYDVIREEYLPWTNGAATFSVRGEQHYKWARFLNGQRRTRRRVGTVFPALGSQCITSSFSAYYLWLRCSFH